MAGPKIATGELRAKPMNILHAMSGEEFGATETAFERTVAALAHYDVAQRIVIRANPERAARLKTAGLEPIQLPFRKRFDFSSKRRFQNEISSFGPDVIVSWTPDVSALIESQPAQHLGYVGNDFVPAKYQFCDHLFTLTAQRAERVVTAGWPADKISTLLPIVAPNEIHAIDRNTWFTPETAKLLVVVARLEPEHGINVLMEAVARISGLYLWIAGDGSKRQEYEETALELGIKPRTRFVGWRHDAPQLVAAADLVVCPSRQDDIGELVLAAWASGKPVIAADSVGPGLLIKHRETGVLVPIADVRSLSEAIKWVLRDPDFSGRIASGGANAFAESYTTSLVAPKYLDLFKSVAAAKDEPLPESDSLPESPPESSAGG